MEAAGTSEMLKKKKKKKPQPVCMALHPQRQQLSQLP